MDGRELVVNEIDHIPSDGIVKSIIEKTYLPQTDFQRSLVFEAESDPINNDQEQTWPTTKELQQAHAEQYQLKKRVPKGTSEYQVTWIVSDEEDNNSIDQEKDFEDDQQDMMTANVDDLESIQLNQEQ